jgi:hypothetical protein
MLFAFSYDNAHEKFVKWKYNISAELFTSEPFCKIIMLGNKGRIGT